MLNIYCDESCHLENDEQKAMVIGAVKVPKKATKYVSNRIKELKIRHGLSPFSEIKWTKVSQSKIQFYKEIIDLFFELEFLTFRGLVVPDKSKLNHEAYNQTHDDFYYKMYYSMLIGIIDQQDENHIYLDIKDTMGGEKVRRLQRYLCNKLGDYQQLVIPKIQQIRSDESQILQLTDLLIGAVSYVNRDLDSSPAKLQLIEKISNESAIDLRHTSHVLERKFNLFLWSPDFWRSRW